jgi:hypothetical protein
MSVLHFYDRDGNNISVDEWRRLLENPAYRHIALTRITAVGEAGDEWTVSTIWDGLDSMPGSPFPAIFETMAFQTGGMIGPDSQTRGVECARYATEHGARIGHAEIVEALASSMVAPLITTHGLTESE